MSAKESAKATRPRRRGVNPWVPNQHGAWAMLVLPIVVGLVTGVLTTASGFFFDAHWRHLVAWLTILVAWVVGYFAFFAAGLWLKARSPVRKRQYRTPAVVYGAVAGVAAAVAVAVIPELLWWAVLFVPLIGVAVWETMRGRPRSVASGVATTVASALMYPVMVSAGGVFVMPSMAVYGPFQVWASTLLIGLYFTGTIFYVKSLIREKGNQGFLRISVGFHWVALLAGAAASAYALLWGGFFAPAVAGVLVLAVSAVRAMVVPRWAAKDPHTWTPKRVGMMEMPLVLILGVGTALTFVL